MHMEVQHLVLRIADRHHEKLLHGLSRNRLEPANEGQCAPPVVRTITTGIAYAEQATYQHAGALEHQNIKSRRVLKQ